MNALLCKAMFKMGHISCDLRAQARICAQDNDPWERDFVDVARELDAVVEKLCEARSDGDEELALRELRQLSDRCVALGYDKLAEVYETLALTPVTD